jgi:hypothetical protein
MGSLKGAAIVVCAIILLVPAVSWVVERAGELAASDATLSLGWRIAIAATSWYVRLLPFIAIGGVALAALVGGYLSRQCSVIYERRALLVWLLIALPDLALPFIAPLVPSLGGPSGRAWIHGFTVLMAVGIVAPVAAIVIGAHLQSRVRMQLASRVRGWHIAGASVLLALLGPALLVPPVWVWVRSGSVADASAAP